MKRKHNEGFSLIDVLVGITLLALVVIPISSGLIMSSRINAKAEQLLQDQLAVSSAVETMMETGLNTTTPGKTTYGVDEIEVTYTAGSTYCDITVTKGEVSVSTSVKWTGGGS